MSFVRLVAWVSAIGVLSVSAALGQEVPGKGEGGRNPNFIILLADDLGYGDAGFAGHPTLKTPHLDQMAKEAVRLDLFYSAAPNCSPTRASVLTGRHHNRSQVFDWGEPIRHDAVTIAHALRAGGYGTGHFGKWHLGGVTANKGPTPRDMGFDDYFSTQSNTIKVDSKDFHHNGKAVEANGENAEVITDRLLEWIRTKSQSKQPFLAYVCYHAPHKPYGSTPKYLDMYKQHPREAPYWACITAMDAQIGRLRAELRQMGLADNTVVWFSSDNGARGDGSNLDLQGGKGRVSEGGTRVLSIVEWPNVLRPGVIDKTPFSSSDIYPTFLAIAGREAFGPERIIDGENMLPVLRGQTQERKKPIFFWHHDDVAMHHGRYKFYGTLGAANKPLNGRAQEVTLGGKGLGSPAPADVEQAMKTELAKWIETVVADGGTPPEKSQRKKEPE